MKNDEPEIKPAYKNPLMEHYECDGQINMFRYLDNNSVYLKRLDKKCRYL